MLADSLSARMDTKILIKLNGSVIDQQMHPQMHPRHNTHLKSTTENG